MTDVPVKPISEIEEKSEVSVNDKILILDSVSEEARLASKSELKGDKGDQGNPGTPGAAATITVGTTTTGAAGSNASVTNSGTSSAAVLNFTIPKGEKGDTGAKGADGKNGADGKDGTDGVDGQDGADGNGITSVTSSKNGKTTTVTMNFDEGDPFSFSVQDGADGEGAGDVLGPSSSTDGHLAVFDGVTGKLIKDGGSVPTSFSPDSSGSQGQVLTKGASGYDWATPTGGDVQVSTDTGNLLSTGVKLWLGDKSDFNNLGSLDANTIYAPIEGKPPFTPGANTVLYFPLENDAVDLVSSVTLTSNGTTNYTTVGGVPSVNFTKSNWLYNTSVSGLPSGDVAKTMSAWVYIHGTNTNRAGIANYGANGDEGGSVFGLGLKPSSRDLIMTRSQSVSNECTVAQDQWTNVVMTYSNSLRTLYVNGVSQVTWSVTAPAYGSKVFLGQLVDNVTTATTFYGNLSNFILENKERTATEVLDYFNKTKSYYGIS